jgi:hypothetical protein
VRRWPSDLDQSCTRPAELSIFSFSSFSFLEFDKLAHDFYPIVSAKFRSSFDADSSSASQLSADGQRDSNSMSEPTRTRRNQLLSRGWTLYDLGGQR